MAKRRINKKDLYESLLKQTLADENYESAAMIRDILSKLKGDEIIEIEDEIKSKPKK